MGEPIKWRWSVAAGVFISGGDPISGEVPISEEVSILGEIVISGAASAEYCMPQHTMLSGLPALGVLGLAWPVTPASYFALQLGPYTLLRF